MYEELRRVVLKPFSKHSFEVAVDYYFDLGFVKGIIPKGFKSDGASIPRFFWSFFPPFRSEYLSACVIHDYLCEKANSRADYILADQALKAAMKALGVSELKIFVFYHACNLYHAIKCLIKGK